MSEKDEIDNTFFSNKGKLQRIRNNLVNNNSHLLLMLDINDYSKKLVADFAGILFGIRFVFYKKDLTRIEDIIIDLVSLGFKVFLQPMNLFSYNQIMVNDLIRISNLTGVSSLGIVDSFGYADMNDLRDLISRVNLGLKREIDIDLHLHNNLGIVNSNIYSIMTYEIDRNIIIDSTICGIGRGAGNMSTESLLVLINGVSEENKYSIRPLLNYIYNYYNEVFVSNDKKYYVSYFLSALNMVHPNYVDYLLDERLIGFETMESFILSIPESIKESCSKESAIELFDSIMELKHNKKFP